MRILFIITASIAIQKCKDILNQLTTHQILIYCIFSDNATKMINIKDFQKIINGKVFTNDS